MPSKILNFSKDRLITGINIIDNMLFFVDGVDEESGEPKKINITKFKGEDPDVPVDHSTGTTHIYNRAFEERDITVIKEHPINSLQTSLLSIASGGGDVIDYGNGDEVDDTDDSGDDYVYDDNTNATSAMTVATLAINGTPSIQSAWMRGRADNASGLVEKGVYYTFDEDYATPEKLVANVGNGVFKKQDNEINEYFSHFINVVISKNPGDNYDADGLAAQPGTPNIWYMAYAIDVGGSEIYGEVEGPNFLKDNDAAPTGLLTNLKLTKAEYLSNTLFNSCFFEAKFDDAGGAAVLNKGFVISKAYPKTNTTVPSYDTVVQQITDADYDAAQEGADRKRFPMLLDASTLNELGVLTGALGTTEFTGNTFGGALQPGYVYYAYAFVETENQSQGVVSSNVKAMEILATTVGAPLIKHTNVTPGTDYVILKAEILDEGDDSNEIVEKGFLVSANPNMISQASRFKEAFPGLASNANGSSSVSEFSNHTKLFKIISSDPLEVNGTGEFQVDTNGILTLEQGETLRYLAYAKNLSGGISYGSETGYPKTGVVGTVNTIVEEDVREPVIRLDSIYYKTVDDDDYELSFSYDISFIPTGRTVQSSGIVFGMPTGAEIAENKYGFTEFGTLDGADRKVDKDNNSFTFAAVSDHASLGTYKLDDLHYDNYPESDRRLFAEAYWEDQADSLENLLDWDFYNPIKFALTAYAYVVLDNGQTTKTELLTGAKLAAESNDSGYTMDWSCGDFNMSYAPCIHTRNNAGETATDLTNTGLTLQGRFGTNSATFNTPLSSGGLGFYYSTTKKPEIGPEVLNGSTEWYDAMTAWVNDAGTTKASVAVTSAMTSHMTGQGEAGKQFYEYEKPISGLTAGSTVYFCAFAIPRQRSTTGLYTMPGLTDQMNRTRFGVMAEKKLPAAHTTPQAGEEPFVAIQNAQIGAVGATGTSVTFAGRASQVGTYYTFVNKGFYYKLKSVVGVSATPAQIKASMAIATGRTQLVTTDFVYNSVDYGISAIIPGGEYYVSAFCTVKANNVETTFISDNYKVLDVDGAIPPQNTKPKVAIKPAGYNFPRMLNGQIIGNNININDKGFYVIGKSGIDLAKPSNQVDFMAIYNSPPSGVVTHKITGALGNNDFHKLFEDQKRDYTYYCIAYATNTDGEEGKSASIISLFDIANNPKFIIADTGIINIDGNGSVQAATNGFDRPYVSNDFSAGDTALVGISTEKGYDGNWVIEPSSLKWTGTATPVIAYKRINGGEAKLAIPSQSPNGVRARKANIIIKHGSDPSLTTSVMLNQRGASSVNVDNDDYLTHGGSLDQENNDINMGPTRR